MTYRGHPHLVVSFSLDKFVSLCKLQRLFFGSAFVDAIDEVLLIWLVNLELYDFIEAKHSAALDTYKRSLSIHGRFLISVHKLDWVEASFLHVVFA